MSDFAGVARLGKISLAIGLSALMLAGCSGQAPKVMFATPNGPVTLNSPASSAPPPSGLAAPPPGLEQPASAQPINRNGTYTGTATLLASNGRRCRTPINVSGFHVNGNAVRFGGFRGTIQPDNGLQMVNRNQWIVGQFEGATFAGQISFSSNRLGPGCSYVLNLQRTGA